MPFTFPLLLRGRWHCRGKFACLKPAQPNPPEQSRALRVPRLSLTLAAVSLPACQRGAVQLCKAPAVVPRGGKGWSWCAAAWLSTYPSACWTAGRARPSSALGAAAAPGAGTWAGCCSCLWGEAEHKATFSLFIFTCFGMCYAFFTLEWWGCLLISLTSPLISIKASKQVSLGLLLLSIRGAYLITQ